MPRKLSAKKYSPTWAPHHDEIDLTQLASIKYIAANANRADPTVRAWLAANCAELPQPEITVRISIDYTPQAYWTYPDADQIIARFNKIHAQR